MIIPIPINTKTSESTILKKNPNGLGSVARVEYGGGTDPVAAGPGRDVISFY